MSYSEPDYLKDFKKLDSLLEEIMEEVLNQNNLREEMKRLEQYSCQTYHHSLNVCRRVILVGLIKNFDRKRINDMATAGLLLDIGYQKIPKELIEQKGNLKNHEFEEIKKHVRYSAEIAKKLNLSEKVIEMIENHHERNNGYGYLNQIKLDQYNEDVQLVAACDCFEALREKRPYRDKHSKRHAVEIMKYQINTDFSLQIVLDVTNTLIFE